MAISASATAFAQTGPSLSDATNPVRVSANQHRPGFQNREQQRIEQLREAREREQAVNQPSVRPTTRVNADHPALPTEQPCFLIESITLDVPTMLPEAVREKGASALPQDRFAFAREWLGHYAGECDDGTHRRACVGKQGLDLMVKALSRALLTRGYVTTRVLLPEQDLSSGTLKIALVPGVIGQVKFADPETGGTWKSALPARTGDLLNLRDLEQGLEQMKRVRSQDVTMEITPTHQPGESDVSIAVKRGKPWHAVASVDNAGVRATGKLQGTLGLTIDNPLGLNDIFNVGANQDLNLGNKHVGSHGWNAAYSVPSGYWTATLSAYSNTYYQQIAGAYQTFVSSGHARHAGIKFHRVLQRSENDVFGAWFGMRKRFGASFIEDTEIASQRRNNTFLEVGFTDRHYFGNAQFDGSLAYTHGTGGFGARPDSRGQSGGPTYRVRIAVLDANLSVPLRIGRQPLRFETTFHGQFSNNRLFYIDELAIGSRYTVRGFDGETMLASERGFYWRNELQAPIGTLGQSLYVGIDYGRVFGSGTAYLAGAQLAGAVIGLRGGTSTRFGAWQYDVFAGQPIYKPAGFQTARVTAGFQVTAQF